MLSGLVAARVETYVARPEVLSGGAGERRYIMGRHEARIEAGR